jgi:3-methyladenine DNA glycosylase AlkD
LEFFLIGKDCSILYKLSQSDILWERRILIIATYAFIKRGDSDHIFKIAKILMNDKHDLIHKAMGWMLREVGKRCSESLLETFLEEFSATMPGTVLRYAIERMPNEKKEKFLHKKRILDISSQESKRNLSFKHL